MRKRICFEGEGGGCVVGSIVSQCQSLGCCWCGRGISRKCDLGHDNPGGFSDAICIPVNGLLIIIIVMLMMTNHPHS